jgi:hypothetical protein
MKVQKWDNFSQSPESVQIDELHSTAEVPPVNKRMHFPQQRPEPRASSAAQNTHTEPMKTLHPPFFGRPAAAATSRAGKILRTTSIIPARRLSTVRSDTPVRR